MRKTLVILSSLCLASCSNVKSEANDKTPRETALVTNNNSNLNAKAIKPSTVPTSIMNIPHQDPEMNSETGFKPSFIAAAALLQKLNNKEKVYIFDVRNKEAYLESHIKTALNKPIPITESLMAGIPKDAHVITYCGCPHHLSSIGAEQITNMGYKDVHVLNEGFWYWKDHKFPLEVATGSKSTISQISVQGVLDKQQKPLANTDIYLKHEASGQLEATRTDANGGYKLHFHLYNYKNNDKFKFYVGDLKHPVQDFSTDKKDTSNVIVNLP